MKTISLRTLLREPLKVKRITRAGESVQITDGGAPLWTLTAAPGNEEDEVKRQAAIDEVLDEALRSKPSSMSLSQLVIESRR